RIAKGNYEVVRLPKDVPDIEKIREIRQLADSIQEIASRLNHLESTRKRMIAYVAHDLKSPATSVRSLIQGVRDGVVQGNEAAAWLDTAARESDRLAKLIDDLQQYSRAADGAVPICLRPVALCEVVLD